MTRRIGGDPASAAPAERQTPPADEGALVVERDELLDSLVALDAEYDRGELTEDDYRELRDATTVRAAMVLRALEGDDARPVEPPRRPGGVRTVVVTLLVVCFAVLAGWSVARSAGSRGGDAEVAASIGSTARDQLARCLELGAAELLQAIQCYDEVLAEEPNNAEAMAYRGWLLYRTGNDELAVQGSEWIGRAVEADPEFPDARAFRAIVLRDAGRPAEALAELDALDALDPPPIISDLVEAFALRASIEAQLEEG
jgi:tetratricopeptide (TPR) repeat protein